jgi:hypothetical protein
MQRPDSVLQALRPALHLPETPEANSVEHFQNTVLRPIIKFQHHLIVSMVTQHPSYVTAKLEVLTDAQFLQAIRVHASKQHTPAQSAYWGCIGVVYHP